MSAFLQNLLVIAAVAGCGAFLGRQAWLTLAGKRSRFGSCCSKGCAANEPKAGGATQKVQFLPAEMLGRKK
jgi:hypothetical protein